MSKTIFYFHGFMSSAESSKAQTFKKFIKDNFPDTKLIIPNIADKFSEAVPQLNKLVSEDLSEGKSFMGSSLGGFFATYFAELYRQKAIVINPAINPSEGLKEYIGVNENYSNGSKFELTNKDIEKLKEIEISRIKNPSNYLLLTESGDEVLDCIDAISFYNGGYIDVKFGGNHSYASFSEKLGTIKNFLNL
jgi:predicted esterase YcpF (UPF0227 family)